MDGRTLEEQEKDINEVLRKAFRTPPKSAPRREALKRLIELAHSPHPKLKIIVAQNLKVFVKDFPELEDEAINAVYDLCEDQVTKVRICGYRAIADVSKEQPKWVKRNADVLVQLLQSDEPDEVSVVKRMLSEHLDMDPAVTLGVLCDQIVPPDEPLDEEEQAIRTRLRSLVISFVTGEAKRAVDRHTSTPGSAAEDTLVTGLLRAVDKLTSPDIDTIVKDVLLTLPSFKQNSPRGKQLLDAVLEKAKDSLKADLNPDNAQPHLASSRYYLELASSISIQKRVAHPSHLLRFYFSYQLASRPTLVRLSPDAQAFVLSSVADILDACEASPLEGASASPQEGAALRKQISDMCLVYLQVFTDTRFTAEQRPWKACHVFLKTCLHHHNEYKWTLPSHLGVILQKLKDIAQGDADQEELQNLIRSLQSAGVKPVEPVLPAPPPTNPHEGMAASSSASTRRIMNVKRKHEDRPAGLPPRPQTGPPVSNGTASPSGSMSRTSQQRASTTLQTRPLGLSIAGAATRNGHQASAAQDDELRAAKRAKKGGGVDESPSLLSRLAAPAGFDRSNSHLAESKRRVASASSAQPPRRQQQDMDRDPVVGFSIKGAAKASETANGRGSPMSGTSLLARLQGDEHAAGGQRKKKRTKAS